MSKQALYSLTLPAIVAFALIGSQAANAAKPFAKIGDIGLRKGGELRGQIVDGSGRVKANETVVIAQKGKAVAVAKTDKNGRIVVRKLRPGFYQIETAQSSSGYRLWAQGTAPPHAKSEVLVVADGSVVRGQLGDGRYGPAIRGAVAGGLITGLTYWALDYNPAGS